MFVANANCDRGFSEDTDLFPGSEHLHIHSSNKKKSFKRETARMFCYCTQIKAEPWKKANFSWFKTFIFQQSKAESAPAGDAFIQTDWLSCLHQ